MTNIFKGSLLPAVIFTILLNGFMNAAFAQNSKDDLLTIDLKNNSLLPKKVTVISYTPGETGNGTTSSVIFPGLSKKYKFKEGTKIYLADSEQVGIVMSGKSIESGKPFLTIKKGDNGKTFKIDQ